VAQLLTLKGYQVVVAFNGIDALASANKLHPDVVFLDLSMPRMHGYRVALALTQLAEFSSTGIVALTV
jgi:CheY-like chemotaxis protein